MKRSITLGLIGFGCVGSGFVRVLQDNRGVIQDLLPAIDLRLKTVCDHRIDEKDTSFLDSSVTLSRNADDILNDPDIDIVLELMGGISPAGEYILKALRAGKSVVTANKALLAEHGDEIFAACSDRATVAFEAAICGGIPLVRSVREGLVGDSIRSFYGIFNGSSNYVLTEIEEHGRSFHDALKDAQSQGYLEKDPSLDVDGIDAAHKVCLFAQMCFGVRVPFSAIDVQGISRITPIDFQYAHRLGFTIKLLGMGRIMNDSLCLSVRPVLIPRESLLAHVKANFNAVCVVGEKVGPTFYYGYGAGGESTGVAVMSDVVSLARDIVSKKLDRVPPLNFSVLRDIRFATAEETFYPYYLRFVVHDQPGIIADIASVFKKYAINIDAVWQEPFENKNALPFVMTLEKTSQNLLQKALQEISAFSFLREQPFSLPINFLT